MGMGVFVKRGGAVCRETMKGLGMRIEKLVPEHFGKFNQKEVIFGDGLNVITAGNESGKTTLCAFLRAMLFGMEKPRGRTTKQEPYSRYLPMDTPGAYQGTMELSIDGKRYRIHRVFYRNERKTEVTELDTGRTVVFPGEMMEHLMPGLSESGYCNTVSVPQTGAGTDGTLAEELRNYIANLSAAKEQEVDVAGALEELTKKAKEIDRRRLSREAEQTKEQLATDEQKLSEIDAKIREIRERQGILTEKQEKLSRLRKQISKNREGEFAVWQERFFNYRSDLRDLELCERNLDAKEQALSKGLTAELEKQKEAFFQRRQLQEKLCACEAEVEKLHECLSEEKHNRERKDVRFLTGCVLAVLVLAITGAVLFFGSVPIGSTFLAAACGVLLLTFFRTKARKERNRRQEEEAAAEAAGAEAELELLKRSCMESPSEQELQERIYLLQQKHAAEEGRKESIGEERERIRREREELMQTREELLCYFSRFAPVTELTESVVSEIFGKLLTKSANTEREAAVLEEEITGLLSEAARAETIAEQGADLENRILENRRYLQELHLRISQDEQEKEAIELAKATIQKLSEEIHDSFGKELNRRASEYVKKLTGGAYEKVLLDEKLTLQADTGHSFVKAEQLSAGTIEQMALAVRFAVADTMYHDDSLPLIFDDAFAYYDDERLKETLHFLAESGRQVLLFTCHQRERAILISEKLPFHEIEL